MRETPGTHADPFAVSAAVLIGGHSRRMGEPKALLRLVDDGETLVERVVARLGAVTREIALVGAPEREAQRWSVFNVNTPADLARARAHAREAG
jgi:molybdopterin-guanine dinucleotide biosynthesis protein A